MNEIYTITTNNGICLETTNNNVLNLFMLLERNISDELIYEYISRSFVENPIKTIAVIFNSRDRNNGKKEKSCSNRAMLWLRTNKNYIYKLNIETYINKYGCWKDILYISSLVTNPNYELKLIAKQLIEDKENLNNNKNISLCAKWAPSQSDKYKTKKFGYIIANYIYKKDKIKIMEKYRKEILVPLRSKINIVETKMCNKKWNEIEYEKLCSNSIKRLKNAFLKNDNERYLTYLNKIKNNEIKIKITGILPHELVKYYMNNNKLDETIELQWTQIINNIKEQGNLENTIPIIDVSGSMYNNFNIKKNNVLPIEVSISLGLLIANCTSGIFKNKVITFSEKPELFDITGTTLFEQFVSIKNMNAGFNTNFESACDLILDYVKLYGLDQNYIPKKIICLSDMQFDNASNNNDNIETVYETIKNKYNSNGYDAPQFIFWNLNSINNVFPVSCKTENTAIISGYSEQLLKIFMKSTNFTPEVIFNEILEPYIKDVTIYEEVD